MLFPITRANWAGCVIAGALFLGRSTQAERLQIGYDPGTAETVTIDSGTLQFEGIDLGENGQGTLIHSGGTIVGGGLIAGYWGDGTYVLGSSQSAAQLVGNSVEYLGFFGSATFIHNNGLNSTTWLQMPGHHSLSRGFYALHSGTLSTGSTSIAEYGRGTFIQTGGLHQTGKLYFGKSNGGGTYLLSGGTLQVASTTILYGSNCIQSGGFHSSAALLLDPSLPFSTSTYTLNGGTLSVGTLGAGYRGYFEQTGGTLFIQNRFDTYSAAATFGDAHWGSGSEFIDRGGGYASFAMDSGGVGIRNLSITVDLAGSNPALQARITFHSSQHLANLSVAAGTVTLTPGANKILNVPTLTLAGQIDLNDNGMVWDYAGDSPIDVVRGHIASARNAASGPWTGAGISSSFADFTEHALGYGERSALQTPPPIFAGEQLDQTSILVSPTWYGDADLNGAVDINDLGRLVSHWQSVGYWIDGDFDYNGFVDVFDLGLLAGNWQAGVAPSATHMGRMWTFRDAIEVFGLSNVTIPEPALSGLLLIFGVRLWHRRRDSYNRGP